MITKDNLKNLLKALNFEETKGMFIKSFNSTNASLSVDFNKNLLIYPEDKGLSSLWTWTPYGIERQT